MWLLCQHIASHLPHAPLSSLLLSASSPSFRPAFSSPLSVPVDGSHPAPHILIYIAPLCLFSCHPSFSLSYSFLLNTSSAGSLLKPSLFLPYTSAVAAKSNKINDALLMSRKKQTLLGRFIQPPPPPAQTAEPRAGQRLYPAHSKHGRKRKLRGFITVKQGKNSSTFW